MLLPNWPDVQADHDPSNIHEGHVMAAPKLPIHGEYSDKGSTNCCLAKIVCMLESKLPYDVLDPPNSTVPGDERPESLFALEESIMTGKDTIKDLSSMLNCACLRDNFVRSLIPLVVQRIMTWYDRATQTPFIQDSSTLLGKFTTAMSTMSEQEAIRSSFCLANILKDERMLSPSEGRQISANFVLGGLHKVRHFIDLLDEHPQVLPTNLNSSFDPTFQGTTLSRETFPRLLTDLRENVHFTASKILTLLRAEQLGEPVPLLPEFNASVWT